MRCVKAVMRCVTAVNWGWCVVSQSGPHATAAALGNLGSLGCIRGHTLLHPPPTAATPQGDPCLLRAPPTVASGPSSALHCPGCRYLSPHNTCRRNFSPSSSWCLCRHTRRSHLERGGGIGRGGVGVRVRAGDRVKGRVRVGVGVGVGVMLGLRLAGRTSAGACPARQTWAYLGSCRRRRSSPPGWDSGLGLRHMHMSCGECGSRIMTAIA